MNQLLTTSSILLGDIMGNNMVIDMPSNSQARLLNIVLHSHIIMFVLYVELLTPVPPGTGMSHTLTYTWGQASPTGGTRPPGPQ